MKTITKFLNFSTKGNNDIIDITYEVEEKLRETKLEEGSVLLFVSGSTAAITTMEYELGQIQDLKEVIDKLIPRNKTYAHNHSLSGSDGNAHSHLRASLFKSDLTVPFQNSELLLGTWQQIVFVDFDIYPRKRKVVLQFTHEPESHACKDVDEWLSVQGFAPRRNPEKEEATPVKPWSFTGQ